MGGPSAFEPFFKHFIQKHASTAVDSDVFKSDFVEFFAGHANVHQIDWQVRVKLAGLTMFTQASASALPQES